MEFEFKPKDKEVVGTPSKVRNPATGEPVDDGMTLGGGDKSHSRIWKVDVSPDPAIDGSSSGVSKEDSPTAGLSQEADEELLRFRTAEEDRDAVIKERRRTFKVLNVMLAMAIFVALLGAVFTSIILHITEARVQEVVQEYSGGDYKKYAQEFKQNELDVLAIMKYTDLATRLYGVDPKILISIYRVSGFSKDFRDPHAGLFGLCMINPVILAQNMKEVRDARAIFVATKYLAENIKARGFADTIYVYFNYDQRYISKFLANYQTNLGPAATNK